MQALIDACSAGELDASVVAAIGTRSDSPALERARAAGVPVSVVSPRKYTEPHAYAAALAGVLRRRDAGLICLCGYMRLLPEAVVNAYRGRILNVHPALLPAFGGRGMYGLEVHRAVIESGARISGCTVHLVDLQYDTGPIVVQRAVAVLKNDTPETLARRVLPEEHAAYVDAVKAVISGRSIE